MPVRAAGAGSSSGGALGWACRPMTCGTAVPALRPAQYTVTWVRSNGSYDDLGVIPTSALPGEFGTAGGRHNPALRSFACRCGEAVEEVQNGVAGLVAA